MTSDSLLDADRRRLALLLANIADGLKLLIKTGAAKEPKVGSKGAVLEATVTKAWRWSTPLEARAFGTLNAVSGADHCLAIGHVLTVDDAVSIAPATLTRSALEAWSRALWMFSSDSSDELCYRHSVSLASELEPPRVKGGTTLSDVRFVGDDAEKAASDMLGEIKEDLRTFASHWKARSETKAQLIIALFANFETPESAQFLYSHLSAVSHGEVMGLNNFVRPEGEGLNVYLSAERMLRYASAVASAALVLALKIATYFGSSTKHVGILRIAAAGSEIRETATKYGF